MLVGCIIKTRVHYNKRNIVAPSWQVFVTNVVYRYCLFRAPSWPVCKSIQTFGGRYDRLNCCVGLLYFTGYLAISY